MPISKVDGISRSSINKIENLLSSNIGKVIGSSLPSLKTYRFYFPSSGTPSISPSYGSWSVTSGAARFNLVTTRNGTADTEKNLTAASSSTLYYQFVSAALMSQTIDSGYIRGQIRGFINGYGSSCLRFNVRICDSTGSITQTILTATSSSTLSNSGTMNRKFMNGSDDTVDYSSFSVNDGDRLVIEIGVDVGYYAGAGFRTGTDSGTDLPQDETTTTAYNPWIEFSSGIQLA